MRPLFCVCTPTIVYVMYEYRWGPISGRIHRENYIIQMWIVFILFYLERFNDSVDTNYMFVKKLETISSLIIAK